MCGGCAYGRVGGVGGQCEQPGTGVVGGGEVGGLPGDAVAPGVDGAGLAALAAPGRQQRQEVAEGRGAVVLAEVEGGLDGGEVLALDGVPEPALAASAPVSPPGRRGRGRRRRASSARAGRRRWAGRRGGRRCRRGRAAQSTAAPRVWRRGERGGERGRLGAAGAQGGDRGGACRVVGVVEGHVLGQRGQDAVGAEFEEGA